MEPTVRTDRTIPNNKPDITFRDNKNGICMLMTVISGDRNVIQQEAENTLKYENLTSDIQRMWNVNVKVIRVVTGATGII
jgi:uncharacterized lipoprotein YehR (DUF1307 family)